jgi:hypothetical protein
MADHDDIHPEIEAFLRDRAGALDHDAARVTASEATGRTVRGSLAPRLHRQSARHGTGRRAFVTMAAIAALLIGSVAGFAVGRSSAPKAHTVATGSAPVDQTTPARTQAFGGGVLVASDGPGSPTTANLFNRTTSDGVTLRGFTQTYDMSGYDAKCAGTDWCPPPECNPSNNFLAEVNNDGAAAVGGAPAWPLDGAVAASRGQVPLGQNEGAPASVWNVQTADPAALVTATWPDGFVDSMAAVQGWAIVGHNGTDAAPTITVGGTPIPNGFGDMPASCQPPPPPPPTLPPAGAEQPDDVAAATGAVRSAYETVFSANPDPTVNAGLIEDEENLKPIQDDLKAKNPGSAIVTVGEIRFLSKTEAALLFDLTYQGAKIRDTQVGYATFIDGTWKISRDTMCMILGWGGGVCNPPAAPARSASGGGAPSPN